MLTTRRPPLPALLPVALGLVLVGSMAAVPVLEGASDEPGQGWLGIGLQDLTPELRETLNLDRRVEGILVTSVVAGSPAAEAGIQEEDVITEIDNQRVETTEEAIELVRSLAPGTKVLVTLNRSGRSRALGVVLGSREQARSRMGGAGGDREVREYLGNRDPHRGYRVRVHREDRGFLGVRTLELEEQLAAYFGVSAGVLVTEVVEGSPAEAAGVAAGDVILAVEDVEMEDPGDLRRVIRKHDPQDQVELSIVRKGTSMTLSVTLGNVKDFSQAYPLPGGVHMLDLGDLGDLDLDIDLHGLDHLEVPDLDIHLEGPGEMDWEQFHEGLREGLEELREELDRIRMEIQENLHQKRIRIHEDARRAHEKVRDHLQEEYRRARKAWRKARDPSPVEETV